MTKPITAKGYIENNFVAREEFFDIYGVETGAKPKLYVYCKNVPVARLKTEKSAIKLAHDLNTRLQGISDL